MVFVAVVCAVALVAAALRLLKRRDDVAGYHRVTVAGDRVGERWVPPRHGGR